MEQAAAIDLFAGQVSGHDVANVFILATTPPLYDPLPLRGPEPLI